MGGLVGYGLGIERRVLPGGAELIRHLGSTAGYRSYVGRLTPQNVTIAFALNWQDDPTPLVIPVVEALAATHRRARPRHPNRSLRPATGARTRHRLT